jgi:hypothetical protein
MVVQQTCRGSKQVFSFLSNNNPSSQPGKSTSEVQTPQVTPPSDHSQLALSAQFELLLRINVEQLANNRLISILTEYQASKDLALVLL